MDTRRTFCNPQRTQALHKQFISNHLRAEQLTYVQVSRTDLEEGNGLIRKYAMESFKV